MIRFQFVNLLLYVYCLHGIIAQQPILNQKENLDFLRNLNGKPVRVDLRQNPVLVATQNKELKSTNVLLQNAPPAIPISNLEQLRPSEIHTPQQGLTSQERAALRGQLKDDDKLSGKERAELEARRQAETAKYSFSASVQDGIGQANHEREETRDGLRLKGRYSFSDGFFKRTVHYQADEGGYRVIKEEVEPIGNGPEIKRDGVADVSVSLAGAQNKYSIHASDIANLRLLNEEEPHQIKSIPSLN